MSDLDEPEPDDEPIHPDDEWRERQEAERRAFERRDAQLPPEEETECP